MKLILSTVVGGIVLFIFGWILYGIIFMDFMKENFGPIMRDPNDYKLWAIIVANFLQAFFLSWIYPKGYQGGAPAKEGLMFGIYAGLLISVPYVFYNWAGYPIIWQAALIDGIIYLVLIILAGLAVGLVYGKAGEKKEGAA
jgi:hypothetical protein